MNILDIIKEDAGARTYELTELISNFPKNHKLAIKKLWGSGRITYKGKSILSMYQQLEEAAVKMMKGTDTEYSTVEMDIQNSDADPLQVIIGDHQECYLGYNVGDDLFYIGFDLWLNEQDFYDQFDKEYKKYYLKGKDYDSNPISTAAFDWYWKNHLAASGLYAVRTDGMSFTCVGGETRWPGLFYQKMYRQAWFKDYKLTDLRLD